jgi:hypothetical protein
MNALPEHGRLTGSARADYIALVEARVVPVLDCAQRYSCTKQHSTPDGIIDPVLIPFDTTEHIIENIGELELCAIAVRAGQRLGWNPSAKITEHGDLVVWR